MTSHVLAVLAFAVSFLLLDGRGASAAPLAHGESGAADELVIFGIVVAGLAALFAVNRRRK